MSRLSCARPKPYGGYSCSFSSDWLKDAQFKDFLRESRQKGKHYFYCSFCHADISIRASGKGDIVKHMKRPKHIKSSTAMKGSQSVLDVAEERIRLDRKVKAAELKIAAYAVEHDISFASVDHLSKLIKQICPDSEIARKLQLCRTKATALTNNVIGKQAHDDFVEILKKARFSIIIDESTDLSAEKYLCVVVRFFNAIKLKISDRFFDLIDVSEACDAESLYQKLVKSFNDCDIPYKTGLLGLGTDGASVMRGNIKSVAALLRKDCPNLMYFRCICHSFQLIASNACEELPQHLDAFVHDVYNYIQGSPKRIKAFNRIQCMLNLKPKKILRSCDTRWLSLLPAVQRIHENWEALVQYFTEVGSMEKNCVLAQRILDRLKNQETKIYLNFLRMVLPYFGKLTLLFQSEKPLVHELYSELTSLVRTFAEFFMKPDALVNMGDILQTHNYLPLDDIYLGLEVEMNLNSVDDSMKREVRRRCFNFYASALKGIVDRFNFKDEFLKNLSILDPMNITPQTSVAPILKAHNLSFHELQVIDIEWRMLRTYISEVPEEKKKDAFEFWLYISTIKSGNVYKFANLCKIVFELFSLPHSSAPAERVFSTLNLNKTKVRNSLREKTLCGILNTKAFLDDDECYNLDVKDEMLKKFKVGMYDHKR